MTADEFIAWATTQQAGSRYELADGEIVAMAPERIRHALIKGEVFYCLKEAIKKNGLPCSVIPDGMAVRVDDSTVYEPDAAVRCGERLADDTIAYNDPLIIVEVLSPSTQSVDFVRKLSDYFRLVSLRHYLIVESGRPMVIHHARLEDGTIQTRLMASGEIRLDPPGLAFDVAALFP